DGDLLPGVTDADLVGPQAGVPFLWGTGTALLWGRLHAGRRSRDPRRGSGPTHAGRDKPGPTGSHPTGPISLRRRQARPACFFVGPALCRPTEPRLTPRQRPHPRWPG